jgi:hypothetical protein
VPTWRGSTAVVEVRRADPQAYARELQGKLQQAGAAARVYSTRGGVVVDVDVPPEALLAAQNTLAQAGLPAQAGLTRVRVKP